MRNNLLTKLSLLATFLTFIVATPLSAGLWPHTEADGSASEISKIDMSIFTGQFSIEKITADFPDPYCEVTGNSSVEPITRVIFSDIDNSSSAASTIPHEDFTSVVGNVEPGTTYTITVEGYTGGNWTNRVAVWIDWNQDDVFDETTERYNIVDPLVNSTGVDGQQISTDITVPAGALAGETRMRVMKKFSSLPNDSCTSGSSYGQTEDYTINVDGGGGSSNPCDDKIVMDCGVEYTATLVPGAGAWTNYTGVTYTYTGLEQVFEFTAPEAGDYEFYVDEGFDDADFFFMDGCSNTAGNLLIDDYVDGWLGETITFTMTAGETIYVIADLYEFSNSTTVTVEVTCPTGGGGGGDYCIPAGTNSTYYLDDFSTTGGSTNISNLGSGFSPGGYGDFTGLTPLTAEQGTQVSFEAAGYSTFGFRIWIDLDQDGIFDSSEVVWSSSGYVGTHEGDFYIPPSASTGTTRMRVVYHWLNNAGDIDPCATNHTYGEFEDYTVIIEAGDGQPIPYCIPAGTNSSYYIDDFSTSGGGENISNMGSGFSADGYGDFYDTHTVQQDLGGTVDFEMANGGTATFGFRIWVDWNQDGIFDSSEVVWNSTAYANTHSGDFTVPAGALEGETRMRIANHWLNSQGDIDPCATNHTYGEFEDYKFIVGDGGGTGPGPGDDCEQDYYVLGMNPASYDNALNINSAFDYKAANDIKVEAFTTFKPEVITFDVLPLSGLPTSFSLQLAENDGGMPGTMIPPVYTINSGDYTSTVAGTLLGYDVYRIVVDISTANIELENTTADDIYYWLVIDSEATTTAGSLFWVVAEDVTVDNPAYQFDGVDWNASADTEFTLKVEGTCIDNSGGGPDPSSCSDITIGEGGTVTSSYIPIYYLYDYSYSQAIYTAAELQATGAGAGNINQIAYLPNASVSTVEWRNWTIYMGNTTKDSFSGNSDWITVTGNMQEVFSGDLANDTVAGEWLEIDLDSAFAWDGTSNIVIAVVDNTDGWGGSPNWRGYASGSDRGIYLYRDNNPIDVDNPGTGTGNNVTATLPQIKFCGDLLPNCADADAGVIDGPAIACAHAPFTLEAVGASYGETGLVTQWQSSSDGTAWTDIAGETNIELYTTITEPTYFRYVVECDFGGSDTSDAHFVDLNTVASECYCIPEGTNAARYIDNFSTTGGTDNISNMGSGFSAGGYGDFYDTHGVTQAQGSDVSFEVDIEGGTAGFRVWVDWNQDGFFDTTEEVAWNSSSYQNSHSGTFTVPADADLGDTRMRIVSHWLSTTGDIDPCATNFTYGEFEDYKFTVVDGGGTEPEYDCEQGIPSFSDIANAYNIEVSTTYHTADDFIVDSGVEFELNQITFDTNQQELPDYIEVNIREDNGGQPGTILHTLIFDENDYDWEQVGIAYGDPIYNMVFDLATTLTFTEGIYWVDPKMSSPSGDTVWWAATDEASHGSLPYRSTDGGATWDVDSNGLNMIMTVSGICSGEGGEEPEPGDDCEQDYYISGTNPANYDNGLNITDTTPSFWGANDVVVEAGENFKLETITFDAISLAGDPTGFTIQIYEDNGSGGVGATMGSAYTFGPADYTYTTSGSYSGYDVFRMVFDLSGEDINFDNTSGTDAAFWWIAIQADQTTAASSLYWLVDYHNGNPSNLMWTAVDGVWAEYADDDYEGAMKVEGICSDEGGEEPEPGDDCDQGDDSNGVDNGFNITAGGDWRNADDFFVSTGNSLNINQIELNVLSLDPINNMSFTFYEDDGNSPGDMMSAYTQTNIPVDAVIIGNAFGYDVYAVFADVDLTFTEGHYWMQPEAHVGVAFWEVTEAGTLGEPIHTSEAGGAWLPDDDGSHGVFKLRCEAVDPPDVPCLLDIIIAEPITRVVMANIDNSSDANSSATYEDFTHIEIEVVSGDSYDVALEGNTDGDWTNYFTIFVDTSTDGEWSEYLTYEIGSITNSTGTDGQQATNTITIPADLADGSYILRVIKNYGSSPLNPCGAYSFGQAEDYTLVVGEGDPTDGECSQEWDNADPDVGIGFANDNRVANDIIIDAQSTFTLQKVTMEVVVLAGEPTEFDLEIYTDDGGFVDTPTGDTFHFDSASGNMAITPNGLLFDVYPRFTVELTMPGSGHTFVNDTDDDVHYWLSVNGGLSTTGDFSYWIGYPYDFNTSHPTWQYTPAEGWFEYTDSDGGSKEGLMKVEGLCATLGIGDLTSFDFTYYPNPVKDVLYINSSKKVESVQVYNLAGQEVMKETKQLSTASQIDVNTLPSGVYIFRAVLEGGTVENFKVIKK